jgi:hypothetical protein
MLISNTDKIQYIQNVFSDEFWDERYPRYGMSGLRAVGVRYVVQNSMHTHKRNRDAITDQEEEWMPGVVEGGIVYKDKMLDYSSDKVIATKEKTLGENARRHSRGVGREGRQEVEHGDESLGGEEFSQEEEVIKEVLRRLNCCPRERRNRT